MLLTSACLKESVLRKDIKLKPERSQGPLSRQSGAAWENVWRTEDVRAHTGRECGLLCIRENWEHGAQGEAEINPERRPRTFKIQLRRREWVGYGGSRL